MKKIVYTVAFISACSFASQAQIQTHDQNKPSNKEVQETVNPDGTLAPVKSNNSNVESQENKKTESKPEESRSAITEKGVPTSKSSTQKPTKSTKSKSSAGNPKIGRE